MTADRGHQAGSEAGGRSGRDQPAHKQASHTRANPRGRRRRTPDPVAEAARFWAKVTTGSACAPPGCWTWDGATTANGYGRFRAWRDGHWTHIYAHRWVWEHLAGPIPPGLYVDHTCHTNDPTCPGGPGCPHRRCVNPDHLELVTDDENRRRARTRRTGKH